MTFWIRVIVVTLIFGCGFGTAWHERTGHYETVLADQQAAAEKAVATAAQAQLDAVADGHQLTNQAETQHAKDQLTINYLHRQSASGQLHVHIPTTCVGPADQSAASAVAGADGEAGVLSGRVDAAFARLQDGTGSLFGRCDQLNIDAIELNAKIAALQKVIDEAQAIVQK